MNTSGHDFAVNVSSGFSNPDRNNLSDSEKSMASSISGSPDVPGSEEFFRQDKAKYFAIQDGIQNRGYDLGEQVKKVLEELGAEYKLNSVTWNSSTPSWRLEVATPSGPENVVLSWDLVDDVLDHRTRSEFQRLKNMVLFGLGRKDLIFKR